MDRTLSLRMTGQDVKALQDALNYQMRRGEPLKVDGIFGAKTDARVREFQQVVKLKADGLAGPKTQAQLYEVTIVNMPLLFMPALKLTQPSVGGGKSGIQPPRLIPQLQWPGPPVPPPSPFKLGGNFSLTQGSSATLPDFSAPAHALGFQWTVPTRKDELDPAVRSRKTILELINDLPVDSKFKTLLISQVPDPVTKIAPPSTGFKWGLAPLFNPLNPTGFGLKGNAKFTVRVTEGKGGLPSLSFSAWGDGKIELNFESREGKARPRVSGEGQVFGAFEGTF